jgi:vacuolar-type H+-ATPase subunit I/STV1
MGKRVNLIMVGAYENTNKEFKGVPFRNGRASVAGPDDLVGNIVKYLRTYGAVPEEEYAEAKALVDAERLKMSDASELKAKRARMEADLKRMEAEIDAKEAAIAEAQKADADSEEDDDGTVADQKVGKSGSSEQAGSSQGQGSSRSSRRSGNRSS